MIPPHVARNLTRHLGIIREFNAEVRRCRELERLVGGRGRYEWEYRTDHEASLTASIEWLDRFEALATEKGLDVQAIYAGQGGKAEVGQWSFEAMNWVVPQPTAKLR